jgi:hypothetical protein
MERATELTFAELTFILRVDQRTLAGWVAYGARAYDAERKRMSVAALNAILYRRPGQPRAFERRPPTISFVMGEARQ